MKIGYDIYESKLIGPIGMVVSDNGLEQIILFQEDLQEYLKKNPHVQRDEQLCNQVKCELHEYFSGERKQFDIKLSIQGTSFRQRVWESLQAIPYGTTISYSELANNIGNSKAIRAVGGANRANHIPIIIPCHRVVGKDGAMVGFAGNKIDTKIKLLQHERTYV
ncbi:MAG: methylated-DNA--[protein]-cysteine S-methyltransferase [Clostridia bacterium]|jgi:methylated-DNA-[protein]-cysteine S-methyltransferase|nr:methylated-DNA--[protein]-cysteine S-methyltransferase [Clostridia bacterium]